MKRTLNRSQQAFIDALLTLMKEKPYSGITVTELSERAQYDRRTYYRYFDNKDEVLYLYCAALLSDMAEIMTGKGEYTPGAGFLAFFEFWEQHKDLLAMLEKQGLLYFLGEKLGDLLYDNVGQTVHDDLPEKFGDNSAFSQYAYYFTLGGLWTSLTLWIKSGMKQTASELTDYVLRSFTEMNRLIG